eukprot:CAMPEP_0170301142 /NCGR_PEP_ID=MMETSP0116_2-20130129/50824_1 /TAXON_ID=400756 /ORGANISM="Durinskia baltica, Strain CSIRO CS-38" /LENGTH=312 /DNA_ID=CAMNT_0010552951 /DNA_START=68 /DNA_END=1002 /DNA_ORIENTATION=-
MGCGSSSDAASQQQQPQYYQQQPPPQYQQGQVVGYGNVQQGHVQQGGRPHMGWGAPGAQVRVQPPNPNDPAFMQTVSPAGTTWGQYVRTGASFVDPKTGYLAGPWAECIAWAVIFEHSHAWKTMPQYQRDGVVGGVLNALEATLQGNPNKNRVMEAAQRLEDDSHALMNQGRQLPAIQQCVKLPQNAVPGKVIRLENPQTPGTYMTVQVPPNAQPGQPILTATPVQPNKNGKMSTGGKVALVAGGAVAAGALAAGVYYGTSGGGLDGLAGDVSGAAGAIGADGALDTVGGAVSGAAGAVGDWAPGAIDTAGG